MGKTRFDANWLQKQDPNGSLYESYIIFNERSLAAGEVYCKICNRRKVTFANRGIASLHDHAKTSKHKDLANIYSSNQQLRLSSSSKVEVIPSRGNRDVSYEPQLSTQSTQPTMRLHVTDGSTLEKEVVWIIHSVMKYASFNSAGKDSKILKLIAPNDLNGFCLYRQKMTDMVNHAIGPYFRDLFLKDVRGEYYSLLFDETEGNNKQKELEVTVKYFSCHLDKVRFFRLESTFLGKATADILLGKIMRTLENAQLPLQNLVMMSRDGPKVNQSLERKINHKLIGERGFQLVSTGSCPAHIIHNAIKYALKEFGIEVSELAKVVYFYFDVPARWEDFVNNSKKKPKKFVKFVETRWVMLGNAAKVLMSNIDELYVLKSKLTHGTKKNLTYHEEAIVRILSMRGMKSMIQFVIDVCNDAEILIQYLESNEFILFRIHEKVKCFMTCWLAKIYDVDKIENVFTEKAIQSSHCKKVASVILPSAVCKFNDDEKVLTLLKEGLIKHVQTLISYLLANNIPHNFYYLFSFLKPSNIFLLIQRQK
ncbi:uncharacterized protein LOC129718939 [Wyeomyia smithii]|uniref:uncharacterized protein LOC129718939 n=1 Tax=Wyeomyia smithii TaxID=174621 RepID=UPI002467D0B6|nr:uncharacterized protein LOC129718939 [Wyeomyia smithii]